MRFGSLRTPLLAVAAMLLGGCEKPVNRLEQQPMSYATREPGSTVQPTHEASFQLIALDGPVRLASLQELIKGAGKPCNTAIKGVLKNGLDGTDEWRVTCADGGNWSIWFKSNGPTEVVAPEA